MNGRGRANRFVTRGATGTRMQRGAVALTVVPALVLAGCAEHTPSLAAGGDRPPAVAVSPPAAVSPSPAVATPCPPSTWPPDELAGAPGVTARSVDRTTVEISNGTARAYWYRVAGWEPLTVESCRVWLEAEVERGPIEAGATMRVGLGALAERFDLPITIALWDEPCGEDCRRGPDAAMLVVRSPLEPPSS